MSNHAIKYPIFGTENLTVLYVLVIKKGNFDFGFYQLTVNCGILPIPELFRNS